ncbi:hypothetical protein EG327_009552 [Venturia inaequalis]|nr:hypothetical protein EG327_009552 [Venturia inaequalis]
MRHHALFKRKKTALELPRENKSPFFELPRELRDQIYDLTLSYDGVQQRITSVPFAQSKEECDLPNSRRASALYMLKSIKRSWREDTKDRATPTVLLICKSITSEAMLRLHKKPLVLSTPPQTCHYHDINPPTSSIINAFISKSTLRSVTRIHFVLPVALYVYLCPKMSTSSARESLLAWVVMILTICQILKKSSVIQELCFQLKNLKDDGFEHPLSTLLEAQLLLDSHSKIQNLIEDLPTKAVTRQGELRDMVYNYSLSYDGIQKVIISDTYLKLLSSAAKGKGKSFLQTPVILLLDKETSSEAIQCLQKKELVFTSPLRCGRLLTLDHVIPRRAFNNIRRIRLAIPETQKLKLYCDCVEYGDDQDEEEDVDLTVFLPLWVNLLEEVFKQLAGSASDSCMVEQLWLQVGAEVLVVHEEMICLLATEAVAIVDEACKDDSHEPDWRGIIEAISKKARSMDG